MDIKQLHKRIEQQTLRKKKADRERSTLLSQTVFLGTLSILLVLPIVIGAYFGYWLDCQLEGYSVRWTLCMIMLGVIIGALNVYLFIKERD